MKRIKMLFAICLGFVGLSTINAEELKIHAIECTVQGDATLLESNGNYLLMDTCKNEEQNQVNNYLETNNVKNLDLYVSHYHADHYGEVLDLIDSGKYEIKNIYLSDYNKDDGFVSQVTSKAMEKNIKLNFLKTGDSFTFENANIDIIGPLTGTEETADKINNMSLVAKVKFGNRVFLTAGDIEKEQEALFVADDIDVKADIMKLSHHGFKTSNTTEFLKKVNPTYAFYHFFGEDEKANFGTNSNIKPVVDELIKTANVLSTGYNGTIIYTIKDDAITVEATRNFLEANVHYINNEDKSEIKKITYPFNKNTYFHLTHEELADYSYIGEEYTADKPLAEAKDINVYYQSNAVVKPIVTPVAETNDDDIDLSDEDLDLDLDDSILNRDYKCQEYDGKYYDKDGNVVSKEQYYMTCGVVDNPQTGSIIPVTALLVLLSLVFTGIKAIKKKKILN